MNDNLLSKYESERQRVHEQSQILHLQGQIDELRRQLRDTNNKYSWAMEQMRKNEGLVNQVQGLVDRAAQETQQTLEGYRRDLTALRKELANALLKIDEHLKPIRELQTQIHHLSEQRKRDQAQVPLWLNRIDLLESSAEDLDTRIRESDERHRHLLLQLDRLREEDEKTLQKIQELHEELQIEKQGLRRQAIEAQQMIADTQSAIQDVGAHVQNQEEAVQRLETSISAFPEQIELLQQQLPEIITELKRIERMSTDRFMMNQERIEDLRNQQNEKIVDLRVQEESHSHELQGWLERIDSWCREYETKLLRTQNRLESLNQGQLERLHEIEVRERRLLDTLRQAVEQVYQQNRADEVASESGQ